MGVSHERGTKESSPPIFKSLFFKYFLSAEISTLSSQQLLQVDRVVVSVSNKSTKKAFSLNLAT